MNRLCVYCGSSPGTDDRYVEAAREFGRLLAERDVGVVYGGASVGVMGTLADATLEAGGEVIGIIPRGLHERERPHQGLTELEIVDSMHERKQRMVELSDGFVALPGGLGTLEELCEILTWAQLGIHRNPCGLLNVSGYWDPLVELLDHAVEEGFVRPDHRSLAVVDDDPEALLARFESYEPPAVEKWLGAEET